MNELKTHFSLIPIQFEWYFTLNIEFVAFSLNLLIKSFSNFQHCILQNQVELSIICIYIPELKTNLMQLSSHRLFVYFIWIHKMFQKLDIHSMNTKCAHHQREIFIDRKCKQREIKNSENFPKILFFNDSSLCSLVSFATFSSILYLLHHVQIF